MIPLALDETRLRLLLLLHRMPRGFDRIDDAITRFIRAAKSDGELGTLFIDNPTREILRLASQSVVTGAVVPSSHPPT